MSLGDPEYKTCLEETLNISVKNLLSNMGVRKF